jgi:hypothetical protein
VDPGSASCSARGQMRGLPNRRVVHAEVAANRPHDDITRVKPDPDANGSPLSPPHVFRVSLYRFLHPQRGVTGAHGMIFMGDGRAKQRHDSVAHHLVDRTLVPMDRVHHQLEHWIEDLPGLLGVAIGQQLHRALEVGEENGDLLALALERRLGCQDLLGEVLGGIAVRSPRRCARSSDNGMSAGVTELGGG